MGVSGRWHIIGAKGNMRNLITGIFVLLAGTFLVVGGQVKDDNRTKSGNQMKSVRDSVIKKPNLKTPAPDLISAKNF